MRALAAAVAFGVIVGGGSTALAAPPSPPPASAQTKVVTYTENDAPILNPARGFYDHTETHSYADGTGWTPLTAAQLAASREDGVSQILRVVYLERYVDADLDAAVLDALNADFATAREAGVSVILRFAYKLGGTWPYTPPYGDAPVERVLSHIEQLTPTLRANADVIAVMQNGFIGLWGEGYYTDHFASDPANPGELTEADWAKRKAVVDALLEALPPSRSVQLRTMKMKQEIFDRPTGAEGALTPDEAFSGSAVARVGHHNDCFLAADDDWGTFLSNPISLDQEYLAAETRYVPMGGETCNVNPPRSEWPTASAEMERYHYSYLNRDYQLDVLNSWGADNLVEARKKLGYRFVLEQSRVTRGRDASISIDVRNEGWAAPYNARPAYLVLDGRDGSVTVPLNSDARTWAPGKTTTVTASLASVPAGSYAAYLSLPAAEQSTAADPRFAIQTANVGTWVEARGVNDLKQRITVAQASSTRPAVAVSKPVVGAGDSVDVRLSGFTENETVTIALNRRGRSGGSGPTLATATTGADGSLTMAATIPRATPRGVYSLRASDGARSASSRSIVVRTTG